MKRPCIAIDVSKGKSCYQCWINEEEKLTNPKFIEHSSIGFEEILEATKKLEKETNEKPIVVFESTGVYHKTLQCYLQIHNIDFIILSPLASAKVRKSNIRSTKTDKKDCKNIAKAYFMKNFKLYENSDEIYDKLLDYGRYYQYLTNQLRKIKIQFRLLLDINFPNFDKLYSNMYTEYPLTLLKKYNHPFKIKNKKPETIAKYLESNTSHTYTQCLKEAQLIINYCKSTVPGCLESSINCELLSSVVEQIDNKIKEQKECERKMISLAKEVYYYGLLVTIPGISDNLASRIIGEIRDINRFDNANSLVAYTGIDPSIYQSGDKDGLHLKITKKGNKNLRCLLYLAVRNTLLRDNKITDYYKKKIAAPYHMNREAAKIACMNKLVRIIYSMCKTGCIFQ